MRNLQLALVSLPFDLLGIFLPQYDRGRVLQQGLLDGFTPLACFVVLNQALGGLLIAAVVKEADSVSKGFATSLAVIREYVIHFLVYYPLSRSFQSVQYFPRLLPEAFLRFNSPLVPALSCQPQLCLLSSNRMPYWAGKAMSALQFSRHLAESVSFTIAILMQATFLRSELENTVSSKGKD